MITVPYSYRNTKYSATTKSLSTPLCGANQSFWMKGGASIYSGNSLSNVSLASSPCFNCVSVWKDQSPISGNDDATILNSIRATNVSYYPQFNADYPAGELSTNYTSFVSFDRHTFSPNRPNFLVIPYNSNFSRLKSFTFSAIFRCRRINPNIVNSPDSDDGSLVSLFENNNNIMPRSDGWGIDKDIDGLRIWYKDNSVYYAGFDGNSVLLPITDWTKWIRLTMRVSGNTLQVNVYNNCDFYLSGNTWLNGAANGKGIGVQYGSSPQQLFIASQIGYDYPTNGPEQSTLNGSWDVLDFTFYDNWLSDSCVQNIWDYYDTQYGDLGCSGNPTKYSTIGVGGSSPTSKNLPIDVCQKYYWSGSIYRQNEINSGGSISELSYYVTNSPAKTIISDVKIYIGHTSLTAFTSSVSENLSASTTNWTLVYDGAITFKTGWSKIPLAKVFTYNNTDNILIKFQTANGFGYSSTSSVPTFKYSATTSNTAVFNLSPSSYPLTNGTSSVNRPIIKFGFL